MSMQSICVSMQSQVWVRIPGLAVEKTDYCMSPAGMDKRPCSNRGHRANWFPSWVV